MSDVGSVKKKGLTPYPSVRRSTDVLQPESGELEFAEALKEMDEDRSRAVRETERSEHSAIREKEREKRYIRTKKRKIDQDEEDLDKDEDTIIDIKA